MEKIPSKQTRRLGQLDVVGEGIAHVLNNWERLTAAERKSHLADLLNGIINPELKASGMIGYDLVDWV